MKFWPILEGTHSSSAVFFGREVYGDDLHPMLDWIFHEVVRPCSNALWWVKHRTTHRYHVVKPYNTWYGWHDTDSLMMSYIKAIFNRYIEKELGFQDDYQDEYEAADEKDDFKWTFHNGIRVHHVGDEKYIDMYWKMKELEKLEKEYDKLSLDNYLKCTQQEPTEISNGLVEWHGPKDDEFSRAWTDYHDKRDKAIDDQWELIVEIVKECRGMWT